MAKKKKLTEREVKQFLKIANKAWHNTGKLLPLRFVDDKKIICFSLECVRLGKECAWKEQKEVDSEIIKALIRQSEKKFKREVCKEIADSIRKITKEQWEYSGMGGYFEARRDTLTNRIKKGELSK
jgi:cell fate regulator YaaT (PSP1 superfamily)